MKKLNPLPLVLLVLSHLNQSAPGQTVHQIMGITAMPDKTISFSLTGSVDDLFGQYFQQYPIEASTDLINWSPLVTLQQSNRPTEPLTYLDKAAAQFEQRFDRTYTNHLYTPLPQPTGRYAVGNFSWLLTDPSRMDAARGTNRQFMATVWYPAIAQAGVLPSPYMDRQMVESGKIFPNSWIWSALEHSAFPWAAQPLLNYAAWTLAFGRAPTWTAYSSTNHWHSEVSTGHS